MNDYLCHMLDEHYSDYNSRGHMEADREYTTYGKVPYVWETTDPVASTTWMGERGVKVGG